MPPVNGQSTDANVPGVLGENTELGGRGVSGICVNTNGVGVFASGRFLGVSASSIDGNAVSGFSDDHDALHGQSKTKSGVFGISEISSGVRGESNNQPGVLGIGHIPEGRGVQGQIQGADSSFNTMGFLGGKDPQFQQNAGVYGQSDQQGVMGLTSSDTGTGVYGNSKGAVDEKGRHRGFGVRGETVNGTGVQGRSFGGNGNALGFLSGTDPVFKQHAGVFGQSDQQGVMGLTSSDTGTGVYGHSNGTVDASGRNIGSGVRGETTNGVGVQGQSFGSGLAGNFVGNVQVTGNVLAHDLILSGGDCAEDFDISGADEVEPGTVMVLDGDGALEPSRRAYDKKVAGVISGAGEYKPGITLDKRASAGRRLPLALVGKVYCRVDAQYSPVEAGDLLTTSPTPGHAMKADDPAKAFGAVIGKALRPLRAGQGLVPILVALQ